MPTDFAGPCPGNTGRAHTNLTAKWPVSQFASADVDARRFASSDPCYLGHTFQSFLVRHVGRISSPGQQAPAAPEALDNKKQKSKKSKLAASRG